MCRITRSPFGPYFSSIDNCLLGAPSSCSSRQSQIYPSRLSTSARPHFTLESGISTRGRSIRTALRMHVSISAIGSVIIIVVVRGPLSVVRRQLSVAGFAATNNGQLTALYQLALRTPGIKPWSASFRKQMRQMPNLRYTARGRPQSWHRRLRRVEYLGVSLAFAILDLLATKLSLDLACLNYRIKFSLLI